MHHGVAMFPTEHSISTPELARAAEQRDIESLWVCEHSHIPVSRRTPWPGGGELPKVYCETLDPFVALASAASVTSKIRLCTGICLVTQRDPIHTAKQVASLDQVSGGRFLFGVGAGWNLEEMQNHGTDPADRFELMRERIEAMVAIWTSAEAEYHGQRVDFDPIYMWPKPVQGPHPPIHVGGGFPGGARRAVQYGNGWIPIAGRGRDVAGQMPRFRKLARDMGRELATLEVSAFGAEPEQEALARYRDAGFSRVVRMLPAAGRDATLRILDEVARLARTVG